jgi:hypothetical protein
LCARSAHPRWANRIGGLCGIVSCQSGPAVHSSVADRADCRLERTRRPLRWSHRSRTCRRFRSRAAARHCNRPSRAPGNGSLERPGAELERTT